MKFYYTYILRSVTFSRFYIGSTDDLVERWGEHNSGKAISTRAYRPWELVYYEAHKTKTLARQAELFYKTGQGRRQLKKKLGIEK